MGYRVGTAELAAQKPCYPTGPLAGSLLFMYASDQAPLDRAERRPDVHRHHPTVVSKFLFSEQGETDLRVDLG